MLDSSITLFIFSFPSHFLSFPWSLISWLHPLDHFTLSLFIYFTLSYSWPFVKSQTWSLIQQFVFSTASDFFSVYVSLVSGALLDIFSLCRYLWEVIAQLHSYPGISDSPLWACSEMLNSEFIQYLPNLWLDSCPFFQNLDFLMSDGILDVTRDNCPFLHLSVSTFLFPLRI